MSKIGMRPISFKKVSVSVQDSNVVELKLGSNVVKHLLPETLKAVVEPSLIKLVLNEDAKKDRQVSMLWGLHRALLLSKVVGLEEGFTNTIKMVGLSCKAALVGTKLVLTLGYSHKIEVEIPKGISVEVDKTAQNLTLKSQDKFVLGEFCAKIRAFKKPEPYKGTGIFVNNETILRKAGKSK